MVRCVDNSLYTGIAIDPGKRLAEHNHDDRLAARYTRARRPVELVFTEKCKTRSEAMQKECALKRLSKSEKEQLVRKQHNKRK